MSKKSIITHLPVNFNFFQITLQHEIEIALKHNGTGYVGLGWRPTGLNGTCRLSAPGLYVVGESILLFSESYSLVNISCRCSLLMA